MTDDKGNVKADKRITAYKLEAEIFCKHMGIDPEGLMQAPHPTLAGVAVNIPVWYTVAGQMFEMQMMLRAMKEGHVRRQMAANDAPAQEAPKAEPSRIITP